MNAPLTGTRADRDNENPSPQNLSLPACGACPARVAFRRGARDAGGDLERRPIAAGAIRREA